MMRIDQENEDKQTLNALFRQFECTAFRFELQPTYTLDIERDMLDAWRDGSVNLDDYQACSEYHQLVASVTATGRSFRRMRAIADTEYFAFQIDACYPYMELSNEEVRLIEPELLRAHGIPPLTDAWIFDETDTWFIEFDVEGHIEGVRPATPDEAAPFRTAAPILWAQAVPYATWGADAR